MRALKLNILAALCECIVAKLHKSNNSEKREVPLLYTSTLKCYIFARPCTEKKTTKHVKEPFKQQLSICSLFNLQRRDDAKLELLCSGKPDK